MNRFLRLIVAGAIAAAPIAASEAQTAKPPPDLELTFVRWLMEPPIADVQMEITNRTAINYDRVGWKCDLFDTKNNNRFVGSTLVAIESVRADSRYRERHTIYSKYSFDRAECVEVRRERLPWAK